MSDLKQRISDLAALMEEFRLAEAEHDSSGERISFRRRTAITTQTHSHEILHHADDEIFLPEPNPIPEAPTGIPVTSPMTGIFYGAPSPNATPFVREGETVSAGQVVGLIEAMKVFNEITAATSGTVLRLVAESGQLVQPGDPLLFIG